MKLILIVGSSGILGRRSKDDERQINNGKKLWVGLGEDD